MPVKLRLRRLGSKGRPYYHIVAADSRSPRDGKFLEKIGTYNPITTPAEITVDNERAVYWLKSGAQPTNTVRAILRYTGANLKFALHKQGKTEEEAEAIFNRWFDDKQSRISDKKTRVRNEAAAAEKAALEAEAKKREETAARIAAKNRPEEVAVEEEAAAEVEETVEAVAEEAPVEEAPAEETSAE
ncbi:MAG: 30S ribosomal protein S16 [Bacteroidia bacterium]|nr:30S ribosomal protein S16 [Bacteroidia bacterium]